ncbi:hypothetical protein RFI_11160, partial [Reticulomyxa filosa]
ETQLEDVQKSGQVLVSTLNERHRDVEASVEKLWTETNVGDKHDGRQFHERLERLKVNNEEWKDALVSSVNTVAEVRVAPTPEVHFLDEEEDKDLWWLDKDEERRQHIDSITITSQEEKKLELLGTYMNRQFTDSDEPVICLYTPQPKLDTHHVLSALYDCELLCEFVNLIDENFIDIRVIHKPEPLKPYPLSSKNVKENVQLLVGSLKALGIHIDHGDQPYEKWSDPATHFKILETVIEELHTKKLKMYVNVKDHPEINQLREKNESPEEMARIAPQQWLKRWLNIHLGKPASSPIAHYNDTLYAVMKRIDPAFASSAPVESFLADPILAAQHMV